MTKARKKQTLKQQKAIATSIFIYPSGGGAVKNAANNLSVQHKEHQLAIRRY